MILDLRITIYDLGPGNFPGSGAQKKIVTHNSKMKSLSDKNNLLVLYEDNHIIVLNKRLTIPGRGTFRVVPPKNRKS